MEEEKCASVSSSNIVMATITKSFSALISLIIISNSIRIRKKIKIRKHESNYSNNTKLINSIHSQRESRFLNPFSLFSVVRFENTECTTSSGTQGGKVWPTKLVLTSLSGTCFTGTECSSQGGVSDGGCAQGFGVCCSFTETCDSTTSQNGTYFVSPTTGSLPAVCSLLIAPVNDNICQVRVNFETLTLKNPDNNGDCKTEYVQV